MDKKVSVIIPCYNQEQYIKEAVDSALNQTYKNIEIIVVDDCSADKCNEILKTYKDKITLIEHKENKGVISSRNEAIDLAEGEFILPLDGDDKLENTYIEKAVKILEQNPKIGIVYCKARFFGDKNKPWNIAPYNEEKMLTTNLIFACALFRKKDFLEAGKYKEYMSLGYEDWDLWLSYIELGFKAYRIEEILFNYRITKEKTRTSKATKQLNDIRLAIFKNHPKLYNNEVIVERIFCTDELYKKYKRKYNKYKSLCIKLLITAAIQLIMIICLVILLNLH